MYIDSRLAARIFRRLGRRGLIPRRPDGGAVYRLSTSVLKTEACPGLWVRIPSPPLRQWSNGKTLSMQGGVPGSIPGWRFYYPLMMMNPCV